MIIFKLIYFRLGNWIRVFLLLFFIFGSLSQSLLAQSYFEKSYGGLLDEAASDMIPTRDSGFVLLGSTTSFGSGLSDFYLVKIDQQGDTVWSRTYGAAENDIAQSILALETGGYLLVGTGSPAGSSQIYVVETDSLGIKVRENYYAGTGRLNGYYVVQAADSGFIILGDVPQNMTDILLVKTDRVGAEIWRKTYGGGGTDIGYKIRKMMDGNYIVVGASASFGNGDSDFYVLKVNPNGDSLWGKSFGGSDADVCYDLEELGNGEMILAGSTNSFGAGQSDGMLMKLSANGDSIWASTFGKTESDAFVRVQQSLDGGFIAVGSTYSYGSGSADMFIVKTDDRGSLEWMQFYGGSNIEEGAGIYIINYKWYLIFGTSQTFGVGGKDFFLIQMEAPFVTKAAEAEKSLLEWPEVDLDLNYNNGIISFNKPLEHKSNLTIYNISGKLVQNEMVKVGAYFVRVHPGLHPGIYLIRFHNQQLGKNFGKLLYIGMNRF